MRAPALIVLVTLLAGPGTADAARTATATELGGSIQLDGRLSDEAWAAAVAHSDFWQREPREGEPPAFRTEFRVVYDADAVYIGVRAYDPEPNKIRGQLTRRDIESSSDWIAVGIDSYHDKRTAFAFWLNPAGVQRDILMYNDVEEDPSWDAVWEGAAAVDGDGWTAEFRIPYSQLRFPERDEHVWGIQVARVVQRAGETTFWTPLPTEKPQVVSLFGELEGIRGIKTTRRLELLPYAIGGARLADENTPELGVGLDLQYGITSNLTLSATINPDFGQVEADPSTVNLGAQEIFFAEKRPFFLEGTDIFKFGIAYGDGDNSVEQLFYSRRIGAPPHDGAADATTIYGAAKLSGRVPGGWAIGALTAVTAEELEDDAVVEPLASYSVLRAKKDWNGGRTNLGLAATGVHRDLGGTGLEWLHDRAYGGGLSLSHRTRSGTWSFDGKLLGSHVHGDPLAIDRTQRASQRYFQRPDAGYLDYDPTRTSLTGFGFMGVASWNLDKHWRGSTGWDSRSPGLELNDMGFQFAADYLTHWLWQQYRDSDPGRVVRNYMVNLNAWHNATWEPEYLSAGGNVNGGATFLNFWGFHAGIGYNHNLFDPNLLRGGNSVDGRNNINTWFSAWSDSRASVVGSLNGWYWSQPVSDSQAGGLSLGVDWQPASNVELSLAPFVELRNDALQFVDAAEDPSGGTHHVLGRIDQTTAGMTVRASYTVSPRLSLQVYAQPFVSSGAYGEYKEAAGERADSYEAQFDEIDDSELEVVDGEVVVSRGGGYRFPVPDFNFREIRSNVVVRWEYLPGSALFVIWSHNRASVVDDGRFRLGHDLGELAGAGAEHVLLMKLTYWWAS